MGHGRVMVPRDDQNQPVLQNGVQITVSKRSGSGKLSGTLAVTTDAQDRAQFNNLIITGTGAHTLSFAATGLTGTTSGTFTVVAVPATALAIVTQPGSAVS